MTTTARDRVRLAIAATALLPAFTALVLVRPAGALAPIGFHALTYSAAAVAPEGEVGAGGGLLPIDGGAPLVRGRVESAPSSSSVAASLEPGTLWSTIAGVVNTEAGEEVIATPTRAEALYPGVPEGSANQFGPEEAGPLRVGVGTALATAREGFATGRAELASYALTDGGQAAARTLAARLAALRVRYPTAAHASPAQAEGEAVAVRGGHAYGQASAAPARGVLEVQAYTRVDELRVADQVVLRGVSGHAAVRVENGSRTPRAALEIAEASVGPFPVAVTPDGVRFAGQGVPARQAADLSAALNEALAAAGVTLRLEATRTSTADGAVEADSGAVRMTIQTPSDGGVPGNTLGVVIGRAVVTSVDEPVPTSVWQETPGLMPAPDAPGDDDVVGTVGPAVPAGPAERPATAAAPRTGPRMLMVAGRAIPASAALAAFAVWQLLSLSTSTLAAIVLRDRNAA